MILSVKLRIVVKSIKLQRYKKQLKLNCCAQKIRGIMRILYFCHLKNKKAFYVQTCIDGDEWRYRQ